MMGQKSNLWKKSWLKKTQKSLFTFLEEKSGDEASSVREFTSNSQAFDFWNDDREDIY
ncbi:MAG: hypothetical protein KGY60_11320 [Bacteroidales bacterium]|nr:hypothetical protein [Bacteroidales bacterium]